MAFLPGTFLSNVSRNDGLAKPSRFRVLLPIPLYVKNFFQRSAWDELFDTTGDLIDRAVLTLGGAITPYGGSLDTVGLSRTLSLQCETTEIPGKNLQTVDVKIYGPTFKVPIQSTYNDITFNFICTNNGFYERKLFERWIESIMPTDTNSLRFPKGGGGNFSTSSGYMTNPKIVQYDDFVKEIHVVELIDAFPTSIAPQPLSWAEENFHRLSVTFTYQRYRTIYTETYETEPPPGVLAPRPTGE